MSPCSGWAQSTELSPYLQRRCFYKDRAMDNVEKRNISINRIFNFYWFYSVWQSEHVVILFIRMILVKYNSYRRWRRKMIDKVRGVVDRATFCLLINAGWIEWLSNTCHEHFVPKTMDLLRRKSHRIALYRASGSALGLILDQHRVKRKRIVGWIFK
jgi:hypothetical protein